MKEIIFSSSYAVCKSFLIHMLIRQYFYVRHIIVFPNIILRVGLQGIVNINKLSLVCNHLKNIRRISTFRAKVDPYISVSGSCIPIPTKAC